MKRKGFTLIEFMVGITMTALVFIVATNLVIAFLRVDSKSQRSQELEQVKSDLSSEFTNTMLWASSVDMTNGVLTVDGNKYKVSGGQFMKNDKALTGSKVLVSGFTVTKVNVVSARTTPSTGTGLLGYYYDNNDLTALKANRIDSQVNFNWGLTPPLSQLADAGYSVRWSGQLEVPQNGLYTFYAQSNSGTRLSVNNTPVFDNWLGSGSEAKGPITLTKGKLVDIKFEYYNNRSNSHVSLLWEGPGLSKEVIPTRNLYPEESQSGYQIDVALTHADSPDTRDAISLFIAPRIQTEQSVSTQ